MDKRTLAIEIMNFFGIYKPAVQSFKEHNSIMVTRGVGLYDVTAEHKKMIAELEPQGLCYAVIEGKFEGRTITSYLLVTDRMVEKAQKCLDEGRHPLEDIVLELDGDYGYALYAFTDFFEREFGDICVRQACGCFVRTA